MRRGRRRHGRGIKEPKVAVLGNNIVTFALIGAGLYLFSNMFAIKFERFLFLVLILGSLLQVSKEGFNLDWSAKIPHNLSDQQIQVFICVAFIKSRNELQDFHSSENQEEAFSKIHNLSSASLDQLHQIYEDEKESEES